MNIAQLIGELDSAVSEAKEAGERVRKAIEGLKQIFGSLGVTGSSVTVIEPTLSLEDERTFSCPYCGKKYGPYRRPHRDSPHLPERFRVVRHIANIRGRGKRQDHGAKKDPIPWDR